MKKFRLYHYWRSSSSWRVRWALALKGFDERSVEFVPVSLLDGESESEEHRSRHPFGFVPALELLEPNVVKYRMISDSIAALEYLEEKYPSPSLLPKDLLDRAKVRSLVEAVNANTQPLQNLSTQHVLAPDSDPDHAKKRKEWARYWLMNGLDGYEKSVITSAGLFSVGDEISFADLCLIPQCYNALRNDIPIENYPTISRIYNNALKTEGYRVSEPDRFKPAT